MSRAWKLGLFEQVSRAAVLSARIQMTSCRLVYGWRVRVVRGYYPIANWSHVTVSLEIQKYIHSPDSTLPKTIPSKTAHSSIWRSKLRPSLVLLPIGQASTPGISELFGKRRWSIYICIYFPDDNGILAEVSEWLRSKSWTLPSATYGLRPQRFEPSSQRTF